MLTTRGFWVGTFVLILIGFVIVAWVIPFVGGVVRAITAPATPAAAASAGPATDIIPRNRVIWVNAGDPEILFDMREVEWSPWFDCEVPCTHQVKCWPPGWAEYEYTLPGGATTLRHAPDKDFKLGTMPSRRFRIRGAPGPARLYIDERR